MKDINKFNAAVITEDIKKWLQKQLVNTHADGFVVGISGGKDSTVVAGLLCNSVGSDKVLGVLMPNGKQSDIDDSVTICKLLNMKYRIINIDRAYNELVAAAGVKGNHTLTNISPRIRMTVLYALAQENNYLVCGTGNLSEKFIGYCTKWGDAACDINPLGNLTTQEVIKVGEFLNLPAQILHKAPSDGLCGMTDEDNLGFSYDILNNFIRTGNCDDKKLMRKIKRIHRHTAHKFRPIPIFKKEREDHYGD